MSLHFYLLLLSNQKTRISLSGTRLRHQEIKQVLMEECQGSSRYQLKRRILWNHQNINTRKFQHALKISHQLLGDLRPVKSPFKTKKTGKFLLVYQIGKTQQVIQFHFICDYKLMDVDSMIPPSMKDMLNLQMHSMRLRDKPVKKQQNVISSSKHLKWLRHSKKKKISEKWPL